MSALSHVRFARDCVAKLLAALRKSNYRIQLNDVLNRCCAPVLVLESILLDLVAKIVLQHNPRESGHWSAPLACPLSADCVAKVSEQMLWNWNLKQSNRGACAFES
jgi:hypothetical protein